MYCVGGCLVLVLVVIPAGTNLSWKWQVAKEADFDQNLFQELTFAFLQCILPNAKIEFEKYQ